MAEELDETPFYGGDTRPAMTKYFGLPITAVAVGFMAIVGGMNLFIDWRFKLAWICLMLLGCTGLWSIYRHDHNALRIFWLWLNTKFRSFDSRHWSGATLEPFPVRWRDGPRGFFDD